MTMLIPITAESPQTKPYCKPPTSPGLSELKLPTSLNSKATKPKCRHPESRKASPPKRLAEESQAGPPDGTGLAIDFSWTFLRFGLRVLVMRLYGLGIRIWGFGIDVMAVVMIGHSRLVAILAARFSGCREGLTLIWGRIGWSEHSFAVLRCLQYSSRGPSVWIFHGLLHSSSHKKGADVL